MGRPVVAALLVVALAGCSSGDGGAASPSHPGTATGSSPSLEGVVLEVVHTGSADQHRVEATVRNTGLQAFYYLWVPQCALEPWSESMTGPDGPVQPREPEAHCLPCGWDALSPGESLTKSYEWDERLWDADDERMGDAPDGTYTWTVTFHAEPKDQDACGGDRTVSASVRVDVG